MSRHPIQPVVVDDHGVRRFKANAIVTYLLDHGPFDMNMIGALPFNQNDREQFAQLIGYSVCGFADLSYASDEVVEAVQNNLPGQAHAGKETEDNSEYRRGWYAATETVSVMALKISERYLGSSRRNVLEALGHIIYAMTLGSRVAPPLQLDPECI